MFNRTANKFFSVLVRKKPSYFIGSVIFSLFGAVLNIVSTALFIILFLLAFEAQSLIGFDERLGLFKYVFYLIADLSQSRQLIYIVLLSCSLAALKNCSDYLENIILFKHKEFLNFYLKNEITSLLSRLNIDYFSRNNISDILLKLNREIDRSILNVIGYQKIYSLGIVVVVYSCLLLLISWQLTCICAILLWLLATIYSWTATQIKKSAISTSQKSKIYARQLIEFLKGIKSIKTLASEKSELQVLNQTLKQKVAKQFQAQASSALLQPLVQWAKLAVVICLFLAADYIYGQPIQQIAPTVLIYLVILWHLFPLIIQLNNAYKQFSLTSTSTKKIAYFLEKSNHNLIASGNLSITEINAEIEFDRVTFAYPNHGKIILDKVTFKIDRAKNTAIIGVSPAEKSAIIDLLLKFYEPIDGKIFFDRQNVGDYSASSLRKSLAVISNNTFLFPNSLAYNLTCGLENVAEAELTQVLQELELDSFIAQLPLGLATNIGFEDTSLTEVQKLQIAIARARLRHPTLLIVDESSIPKDMLAQPIVKQAIAHLRQERTTLTITNQLSTIKNADWVVIFNRGTVMESGTHTELLHQKDFYYRWYAQQFKTSHQFYQQKLAQKIAKKLARQTNPQLSAEIRQNVDELLSYLHLIHEDTFSGDGEQLKTLDESYQSAQDMLFSLREYERKIAKKIVDDDREA